MNGGIYTGYVIDNNAEGGYNPVQVWVPALDGNYVTGEWNAFGANTGSAITSTKLNELRISSGNKSTFYRTMPVSSGSDSFYLEDLGASTVNLSTWQYNSENGIEDMRYSSSTSNYGSIKQKGDGKSLMPAWSDNELVSNYTLGDTMGIGANTYAGQPQGEFTSISVGTRVLVCFADSGATGFILAQIPSAGSYNLGIMTDVSTLSSN